MPFSAASTPSARSGPTGTACARSAARNWTSGVSSSSVRPTRPAATRPNPPCTRSACPTRPRTARCSSPVGSRFLKNPSVGTHGPRSLKATLELRVHESRGPHPLGERRLAPNVDVNLGQPRRWGWRKRNRRREGVMRSHHCVGATLRTDPPNSTAKMATSPGSTRNPRESMLALHLLQSDPRQHAADAAAASLRHCLPRMRGMRAGAPATTLVTGLTCEAHGW